MCAKKIIMLFILLNWSISGFAHSFSSSCTKIYGVTGVEDIAIYHSAKIAYLAANDNAQKYDKKGQLYSIDLDKKYIQIKSLKMKINFRFHPHGIYFYHNENKNYLYVVNHRQKHFSTIELFEVKGKDAIYKKSFYHPMLKDPNDLYVRTKNQFYVTNYGQHNVLYYNNGQWSEVAKNIPYANGIEGDHLNHVYVVSTLENKLKQFKMVPETGQLQFEKDYKIGMFGDNVSKDEHGNLWVAGHPSAISFIAHQKIRAIVSPSKVSILLKNNQGYAKNQTVFMDDGRFVSDASVAAPYHNKLLVGTVMEPYILQCKL